MAKRIKPVSRIIKIEAEINKIIGEAFFRGNELPGLDESWVPCVDISEKEDEIIVEIELPGVAQKDISLLLHSNKFEVRGIKKESLPSKKIKFFRLEREYGKFRRVVFFPCTVETENAKATMENGILTIKVQKYRHKRDKEVMLNTKKAGRS